MSEQLKPCPFCGGKEIGLCYAAGTTPENGSDWYVQCYGCHFYTCEHDREATAIAAWNTRTTTDAGERADAECAGYVRGLEAAAEVARQHDECGIPAGETTEHAILALKDQMK